MRRHRRQQRIEVKTAAQLELMRRAGQVTATVLQAVLAAAEPGVSTAELDLLAAGAIASAGAVPSFKGYLGYPATICTSVNEQVVHAIPGPGQVLAAGDVLSVDCGAIVDGWHGDCAATVVVGGAGPDQAPAGLLSACEAALAAGIAAAQPGGRLSDISHAVQEAARAAGRYGLVREYTGHGIGRQMHMWPDVPNFGPPGRGPELAPGMTLAIEPMLTLGRPATRLLDDDWTVVTADGSRAAHFEHTIAITDDGPAVLTVPAGAAALPGPAAPQAGGRRGL